MSGINKEYEIYLKVLTPLHIGGAQEKNLLEGLDYIQLNDGSTWKLDWEKIYNTFDSEDIAKAIIKKGLRRLVENELEDVAVEIEQPFGDTREIKAFIRDGLGRVFVPGSSIKGAMKAWTHSALEKEFGLRETGDLLGAFDSDIFRFIEASDCFMQKDVELYPTKAFNLRGHGLDWEGGWKHAFKNNTSGSFSSSGFVTDYECFSRGSLGQFTLRMRKGLPETSIDTLFFKKPNARKSYEAVFKKESLNSLFNFINYQTKRHIVRELGFFKHFNQAENSEEIITAYETLSEIASNLKGNQCLLRLSAGSGFHGITGDFQFDDHTQTGIWSQNDAKKYKLSKKQSEQYVGSYMKFKSRKIAFTANEMYPMGFVLLSTQPFEDKSLELSKSTNQPAKSPPVEVSKSKIEIKSVVGKEKDATQVKKGDVIFGEVIKVGKPFCRAKLFLSNYNFSGETDLSGTKKYQIAVGQIVKCELGNPSPDGEFKQVKFIP